MGQSADLNRVTSGPILLSRRTVLRAFVGAGAGLLLTACGGDDLDPFASYRQPEESPDSATARRNRPLSQKRPNRRRRNRPRR